MIVQQIVYTGNQKKWWALAGALGMQPAFEPDMSWAEFHGNGVLAVHPSMGGKRAGSVDLYLLVEDLRVAEHALGSASVVRSEMAGVGPILTVTMDSGNCFSVGEGNATPSGVTTVQPVWFDRDFTQVRHHLEALGMRASVVAEKGGWVELVADGGTIGLHAGMPRIDVSFTVAGDLCAIASTVRAAGFAVDEIDEAFAPTLRIENPDGGERIWVNGVQDDFYGYRRA